MLSHASLVTARDGQQVLKVLLPTGGLDKYTFLGLRTSLYGIHQASSLPARDSEMLLAALEVVGNFL